MTLAPLHEATVAAVRRAGTAILGFYRAAGTKRGLGGAVRDQGGGHPVTEADLASNRILEEALRAADPEAGWLSEESPERGDWRSRPRCWMVDPLDGTREFSDGLPEFVVSVGYIVDGEPLLGVLYNPVTDELFSGIVGVGAWRNDVPAQPSTQASLDAARIVCSRTELRKGWFAKWSSRLRLQPVGSVAYKLGLVAAGLADASFTPNPRNGWDLAGGVAIMRAAGARATDRHGRPLRFDSGSTLCDGVCATNGPLHEAVLELLHGT